MRRTPKVAWAVLACALAACSESTLPLWGDAPAEGLDLRAVASSTEARLLEPVELTVDLFVASGREVEFRPATPPKFAGAIEARFTRDVDGGKWTRYGGALRPLEVGTLTIPAFEVKDGERAATTGAIDVVVGSLLEGQDQAVEAPAGMFPAPPKHWPYYAGAGVLLALVLLWWLRRRLARRAPKQPIAFELPPHTKALRALAGLRNAPRRTAAEIEAFYVAVSQILRTYLEDRFGLRAPERTTEEFLPEVERSGLLAAEQRAHLRQFLEQCDLVKFAAVVPRDDVHAATFAFAEGFVESTRPDRTPAAEAVAS